MAEVKRFYQFNSLAELNAAKASMPYPSIARIHDNNDLYVFYRHDADTKQDTMFTVSNSRFMLGYSCLGGSALLGSEVHPSQTVVPEKWNII